MKVDFDFHTHTDVSDGSLSPSALVRKAKREGLRLIAITDHDNIDGIPEAVETGRKIGIDVIPGVEISIDFKATMHMCGYFIDITDTQLRKALKFVQDARRDRNPQIIDKLNKLGMDVRIEDVKKHAGRDQIGRPHFAKALIEKGYVTTKEEAFEKYLAKGRPAYVDKKRLDREKAVKTILDAGGTAVLAHPKQLRLDTAKEYRKLFMEMKELGVSGIEAYSSCHTEDENKMFREIADELGMLVTGGSDFHGDTKQDVELGEFGENIDIDVDKLVEKMKA